MTARSRSKGVIVGFLSGAAKSAGDGERANVPIVLQKRGMLPCYRVETAVRVRGSREGALRCQTTSRTTRNPPSRR